jgi:hypothetical protein
MPWIVSVCLRIDARRAFLERSDLVRLAPDAGVWYLAVAFATASNAHPPLARMTSFRTAPLPLLVAFALVLATTSNVARASDVANGLSVCAEGVEAAEPDVSVVPASDALDAVVPCGLADGGLFGPSCLDARFYVLTPTGVVLCTVNGLALQLASASPHVVTADGAPSAPRGSAWTAVGLPPVELQLPLPPLVVTTARALALDATAPPVPLGRAPVVPS